MSKLLVQSKQDQNRINELLEKDIPSYRQAYSDRTAWIMACLAELSYLRFNPLYLNPAQKERALDHLGKIVNKDRKSLLPKLIDQLGYDPDQEREQLEAGLKTLKIELKATFSRAGAQAILVQCEKFIALAFRGTETDSLTDMKTDMEAQTTPCDTGGKVHTGFKDAFEQVEKDIQETLDTREYRETPLFITGHSLGGALATIAVKRLSHAGGVAGCYTFGSPKVGDDEWIADIKAPVYRVVNAADCVPWLPPGTTIMFLVCWIAKQIPYFGESLRAGLARYRGYLHCGDIRYLSNCPKGKYEDVKLLPYVPLAYRIKGFAFNLPWIQLVRDHKMEIYRKKLMIVAEKRNQAKPT